ncbi:MAG: ABC transporter ATP-binding protein, partial [Victivallaceae bacterium]
MSDLVLDVRKVAKSYRLGPATLDVLIDINFELRRGEFAALLGASGSGKTTLLNLLGLLEKPDRGTIVGGGVDYATLAGREASRYRNATIGFVFQSYCLLPEFSILENVMLPGMIAGGARRDLENRARELLGRVGLGERLSHRPNELSGGEQQRASIARSLINDPVLLLADEPTGNLDAHTGEDILRL